MGAGWTDLRIEQLRELWAKGLSCSQIALEMGGLTRNAVIGKASRLGLEARKPLFNHQRATCKKIKEKFPQRRRRIVSFERPEGDLLFDFAPAPVALEPLRVTLLDLEPGQCRYPVTDLPPHFFCGHPQESDSSYCAAHHHSCSTKPRNVSAESRDRIATAARKRLLGTLTNIQFMEAAE